MEATTASCGGATAVKARKIRLNNGLRQLSDAVRAEVEEKERVAIGHARNFVPRKGHGLDEFIRDAGLIGGLHCSHRVQIRPGLAVDKGLPGQGQAFPVLVSVHGVVAAGHAGHAGAGLISDGREQVAHIARAAVWGAVATVHEAVDAHGHLTSVGQGAERLQVADVAVHAPVGEQPGQMQTAAGAGRRIQQGGEYGVGGKAAVLQSQINAGHVLINNASRADIKVPHLGIAHVTRRQAHVPARSRKARMGAGGVERVQVGGLRQPWGVARTGLGQAPAVQNKQQGGGKRSRACRAALGHCGASPALCAPQRASRP